MRQLISYLSSAGIETWVDQRDLPVSLPWLDEVRDAVEEAGAFLICDSSEWRASPACAAEKAVAEECGKPIFLVPVGADHTSSSASVVGQLQMVAPGLRDGTELRIRSRDWARAGRPKGMLVGRRVRRRLAKAIALSPEAAVVGREFLRDSRRRTIRRAAISIVAGVTISIALSVVVLLQAVRVYITKINEEQAQEYQDENDALSRMRVDVYAGLDTARSSGTDETAARADIIDQALATPVPDDAFRVPAGASGFASTVVGEQVFVLAKDGTVWNRASAATDVRDATSATMTPPTVVETGWTVAVQPTSAVISLRRNGTLLRTIVASAPVTVGVVSPSGRFVAVSTAFGVEIFDVETGDHRTTLRGADRADALAWSSASDRVWATAGGTVVSWPFSLGRLLVDEPAEWFQAIFPGRELGTAWVADRDGALRLISLETGQTQRTVRVNDVAYLVAGDATLDEAVIIGSAASWIVNLTDGSSRTFNAGACDHGRPALDSGRSVILLPCSGGPVKILDARDGHEEQSLDVPFPGSRTVVVSATTGRVYVGSKGGQMYRASDDLTRISLLTTVQCRAEILAIAIAPEDAALSPVGTGAGEVGCGTRAIGNGGGYQWDALIDALPNSISSQATSFMDDGQVLVVGYSDGTVVFRPTANLLPAIEINSVSGAIRDMYYRQDTNELFVVTRTGVVEALSVRAADVTNRSLADRAGRILDRARELGLAS